MTRSQSPTHTPAPWRVVADDAASFWVEGSDGFSVCRVRSDTNADRDDDATLANARLIAEAPAMLEALRLIARSDGFMDGTFVLELQQIARAELQRIEGEPRP